MFDRIESIPNESIGTPIGQSFPCVSAKYRRLGKITTIEPTNPGERERGREGEMVGWNETKLWSQLSQYDYCYYLRAKMYFMWFDCRATTKRARHTKGNKNNSLSVVSGHFTHLIHPCHVDCVIWILYWLTKYFNISIIIECQCSLFHLFRSCCFGPRWLLSNKNCFKQTPGIELNMYYIKM